MQNVERIYYYIGHSPDHSHMQNTYVHMTTYTSPRNLAALGGWAERVTHSRLRPTAHGIDSVLICEIPQSDIVMYLQQRRVVQGLN